MQTEIKKFTDRDLGRMIEIWNEIVTDGTAFPQEELLDKESGQAFFSSQTDCRIAVDVNNRICGLYILHPNNVGRCGHICNASFAVDKQCRGLHIGKALVRDCLSTAKRHGFKILQFNAVVSTNTVARHLYEKLGFKMLGTIPKGFRAKDGTYEDICPYYHEL